MWQSSGFDDGFGGGGGFDANVSGTPGGTTDKKRSADTIASVTIKQMKDCTDEQLRIGNTEIGCVCLVGIVKSVEASSMKIVYQVEDHTGCISVMHWLNEDRPSDSAVSIVENTYCHVYGKMRSQNDKKFIMAFQIRPVTDLKDLSVHKLKVMHTLFKLEQLSQQETEMFSAKTESNSDMMGNTNGMQYGGMSAGDATNCGLNPQQLRVYRAIQQCRREGGASREEIASAMTVKMVPSELEKLLDFLVSEGHIYTTTDDNHFMATDFA